MMKNPWSLLPAYAREHIPHHLRAGLDRYFLEHLAVGSFLQAVLSNDLSEAVRRADRMSLNGLVDLVRVLNDYAPVIAWGSPRKYSDWIVVKPAIYEKEGDANAGRRQPDDTD